MLHQLLSLCLFVSSTSSITAFVSSPYTSGFTRSIQKTSPIYTSETSEADSNSSAEAAAEAAETTKDSTPEAKEVSSTDDILNSPAFLSRKLQILKDDLESMDETIASANEELEAAKAEWGTEMAQLEFERGNIKKRINTQKGKANETAKIEAARELMKMIDTYEMAFSSINPESDEEKDMDVSYRATYDTMMKLFTDKENGLGMDRVKTVGEKFDAEYHAAVYTRPDPDHVDNIICEECQSGFMFKKFLVRPAAVVVTRN